MNVPFLNLKAQYQSLAGELDPVIQEVMANGHYVLGPHVAAFEEELATFVGARFGVGVNSGSDALTLALRALEIGPGDEVITSPFTYIAPAESIHQMGARIVFADIDPATFLIDPRAVDHAITPRTRAVIPVHLFGQMADLPAIRQAIGDGEIAVVEDCAQAIGARQGEVAAGSTGTMGCFSFYPTKNLGANGDGGMVVTSDEGLVRALKMLRVHGIERRYYHDLHGFNSRLDEVQAAILRVKLRHLNAWNDRRREIAARYDAAFELLPLEKPAVAPGNHHVFHVYALLCPERDALKAKLEEQGVASLIYYPLPLHLQKLYANLGFREGDFPVAEAVSRRILPLPLYPELTDEQVDHVIHAVQSFYRK